MMKKLLFAFTLTILVIFSTLVGCSPDSENPPLKVNLPPPKETPETAIKGFPIEIGNPKTIWSIVPLYNIYNVDDEEKINKFVEMLNNCSYEKREEKLELDVDYWDWMYSPMDITLRYENTEEYIHFSLFIEGYITFGEKREYIYEIYGLDRQVYCDTFGIEMPNT